MLARRRAPIASRGVIVLLVWAVLGCGAPQAFGQARASHSTMAFTITMPEAASHKFHVSFRVTGLRGQTQDFKMPAWMPGYYRIMDYARNVSSVRVEDGAGHALPFEKTTRNTWRVAAANAPAIVISYDVTGSVSFAAQNFLDEKRAFIAPPGLFLYVAGRAAHPVTVSIQPPSGWTRISTGLDPVPGKPNTFTAADFDVLFDCPILMGNQEVIEFQVQRKAHRVVLENVPASVDREKTLTGLKRMVEAAAGLIGDVPYKHYTFLMIGNGNGGIEHLNSAAIFFNGASLSNENGYLRWLSYVAHEYFHNFNVKRIRPLALGPFDYDRENLTNMLWVSEGLSVYYQDLVLVRAGLMTQAQYLEKMAGAIGRFENAPGHHYQSATDSSFNTWGTSGVGGDRNTTISYYDNGAMLGAMLDLKIRTESKNRKSLDDVMRALYRKYYQTKRRGFTDAEFRQECELAAGGPLVEVFDYAATTKDVDYAKYFAYAGLTLTSTAQDAPGTFLGVNTQTAEGRLTVSGVTAQSPAEAAGLAAEDQILEVDGARATPKALNDALSAKKPGDKIRLRISRAGQTREVEAVLEKNSRRTYSFQPAPGADALQSAILKQWLRVALPPAAAK